MPGFNAASRESDVDFQPSPLCTEISLIINLLIMLCTIDDEIFKVFVTLRKISSFFKQFVDAVFGRLLNLCALLLRNSLLL